MTKIMKKASSILLALAMVITMIPFVAAPAFADDVSITIAVNGQATEYKVAKTWLDDTANWEEPQVFSFLGSKGNDYRYDVVEGPSLERVFKQAGIGSLDEIKNATISFNGTNDYSPAPSNGYSITVGDLLQAKDVVEVVRADGSVLTAGTKFNTLKEDMHVRKIAGSKSVTPVLAMNRSESTETMTYEEACIARDNWVKAASGDSTKAGIPVPYVGGNVKESTCVCDAIGGASATMDSVNWNGKFSTKDTAVFSLYFKTSYVNMSDVKITVPKEIRSSRPKCEGVNSALTDKEILLAEGITTNYYSNDNSVAIVDKTTGLISPVSNGKCTITVKMTKNAGTEKIYICIGKYNLTVNFTPAKVTKVKVKNIKKKAAKISWKKVSNATGYKIFRRMKGSSKYKEVKKIEKNVTTFTDKKLKKNKKYYYKVRAYQTANNKTYYGAKSDAKGLWIKK